MGGQSFENYSGNLDVAAAYRNLVDNATDEYGTDAYNGTISTTSGYVVVPGKPMSIDAARQLAESRLDKLSKWGHCEAIAISGHNPEHEQKHQVRITVPAPATEVTREMVAAELGVPTAQLLSYHSRTVEATYGEPEVLPAVKARMVFQVDGLRVPDAPPTFETEEAALDWVRAQLGEPHDFWNSQKRSVTIRRVEVASRLTTVTVERLDVTCEVKAVVATDDAPDPVHKGWLFYGWAAS